MPLIPSDTVICPEYLLSRKGFLYRKVRRLTLSNSLFGMLTYPQTILQ